LSCHTNTMILVSEIFIVGHLVSSVVFYVQFWEIKTCSKYLFDSHLQSGQTKIKLYRTIVLPIVLYGCETQSVTLREEYRLRLFGHKTWEVTEQWRKLCSGELHDLYSSPNTIQMIKSGRMRVGECGIYRRAKKWIRSSGWEARKSHWEDLGVDGRMILNKFKEIDQVAWTGYTWCKIGNNGRKLWIW